MFGILVRIGCSLEREWRKVTRKLMLAVSVRRSAGESGRDHEGPEQADSTDHIAEDFFVVPDPCRFLALLREAVFHETREELLAAVQPPGLEQFFRADDAERLEQLRADHVLPTLTACQREVRNAGAVAASGARDQAGVFVVRVRCGVHHARRRL